MPIKLQFKWKNLGCGVYQSCNGIRVGPQHYRTLTSVIHHVDHSSMLYRKCYKLMQNNKRAMMLYAEIVVGLRAENVPGVCL